MRFVLAFLGALFFAGPALATDYYFETGQGAGACTEADPCSTIAQLEALNLNAGDNVFFNCGDTFNDETLDISDTGTSGSHITYAAGGPGCSQTPPGSGADVKPIVDAGSSFAHAIDLNGASWVDLEYLEARGTAGAAGNDTIRVDASSNITMTGLVVSGIQGGTLGMGIRIGTSGNASNNITIDQSTVKNTHEQEIGVAQGSSDVAITNTEVFEDQVIAGKGNFSLVTWLATAGNNLLIEDSHFYRTVSQGANTLDVKVGIGHEVNRTTFGLTGGASVLIQNPDSKPTAPVIVFNDSIWDMDGHNGIAFVVDDDATATVNRSMIFTDSTTETQSWIQVGTAGQTLTPATLTMNASVMYLGSGTTPPRTISMAVASNFECNNCAIINRNGNSAVLRIASGWSGSFVRVRNSILAGDGILLADVNVAGSPLVLSNNLYDCNQATCIDDNGTTYSLAQIVSSLDTNGATGDPLFASEDETSDLYLMLNTGSPGIGLGDPSNLYATPALDLLGYPFNGTTPNAGARSQRIQIKASNDNAPPPANDNRPVEVDLGGPWAVALRCDCEPTALNWPRSFELTCRCAQRM